MDFTYFIALGLALVIGFVGSIIFVARRGQSKLSLIAWATVASVAADFALLINWSFLGEYPTWMLALDLAFFVLYGLVGTAVGVSPVLIARKLLRKQA